MNQRRPKRNVLAEYQDPGQGKEAFSSALSPAALCEPVPFSVSAASPQDWGIFQLHLPTGAPLIY